MTKADISGLVTLWRSGTFEYRALLLGSWPIEVVAEVLKALKIGSALDLVEAMREGIDD